MCPRSLCVPARGTPGESLECLGEVALVEESHSKCNFRKRQGGPVYQLSGSIDPVPGQVLRERHADLMTKGLGEPGFRHGNGSTYLCKCQLPIVVLVYEFERSVDIARFPTLSDDSVDEAIQNIG